MAKKEHEEAIKKLEAIVGQPPKVDSETLQKARELFPGAEDHSLAYLINDIADLSHRFSMHIERLAKKRLNIGTMMFWTERESITEAIEGSVLQVLADNAGLLEPQIDASEFMELSPPAGDQETKAD